MISVAALEDVGHKAVVAMLIRAWFQAPKLEFFQADACLWSKNVNQGPDEIPWPKTLRLPTPKPLPIYLRGGYCGCEACFVQNPLLAA